MAESSNATFSLGASLPDFTLSNAVDGRPFSSSSIGGEGVLVAFICNHCPYVVHLRAKLVELANDAVGRGLVVIAINSNSQESHPQDGPAHMKTLAIGDGFRFPFLYDRTQDVARAFDAACTPEFFLFDGARKLVYHGQFDDSRPGNGKPVTGDDLRAAIDAVLADQPVPTEQRASIGCSIKWHRR